MRKRSKYRPKGVRLDTLGYVMESLKPVAYHDSYLLDLKIKLVQGYPGSADILLAVERNEVQGGCVSYDTIARNANYRDKKIKIVFQAAPTPDPRIDAQIGRAHV